MITHHPSEDLLLAYGAGCLDECHALVVAAHLALCPPCRAEVACVEAIGGALMEDLPPLPLAPGCWQAVLAGIAQPAPAMPPDAGEDDELCHLVPQPVRLRLPGHTLAELPWRRLGPGIRGLIVTGRRTDSCLNLLHLKSGTALPRHGHLGGEVVMVLAGGFADEAGCYGRGDVAQADERIIHQPKVDQTGDCLCLSVTDAPLRFFGLARWLQPLLRY